MAKRKGWQLGSAGFQLHRYPIITGLMYGCLRVAQARHTCPQNHVTHVGSDHSRWRTDKGGRAVKIGPGLQELSCWSLVSKHTLTHIRTRSGLRWQTRENRSCGNIRQHKLCLIKTKQHRGNKHNSEMGDFIGIWCNHYRMLCYHRMSVCRVILMSSEPTFQEQCVPGTHDLRSKVCKRS